MLEIRDWIAGIAEPIVGVAVFWPTWSVMIALSALLWHRGGRKEQFRVLVECRNREGNIDVDYVHTVSGRAADIQWYSDQTWIVASVGFAPDAVQLATAKNIHSIVLKPQGSMTLLNPSVPTRSRLRGLDLVTDPVHTDRASGPERARLRGTHSIPGCRPALLDFLSEHPRTRSSPRGMPTASALV